MARRPADAGTTGACSGSHTLCAYHWSPHSSPRVRQLQLASAGCIQNVSHRLSTRFTATSRFPARCRPRLPPRSARHPCTPLQVGTLGSGAFSTVVRARDRQAGEEVAVKLIKRGSLVRPPGLGLAVSLHVQARHCDGRVCALQPRPSLHFRLFRCLRQVADRRLYVKREVAYLAGLSSHPCIVRAHEASAPVAEGSRDIGWKEGQACSAPRPHRQSPVTDPACCMALC